MNQRALNGQKPLPYEKPLKITPVQKCGAFQPGRTTAVSQNAQMKY
jgi:hypothetical protein